MKPITEMRRRHEERAEEPSDRDPAAELQRLADRQREMSADLAILLRWLYEATRYTAAHAEKVVEAEE